MTKRKETKLIILPIICLIMFFILPTYAKEPITSGKGIWINIWNYPANPDMYCEYLKSKGIDIIYLQVSRSNTPAIKHPAQLNKIIESSHSRGMKVIGWSYVFLQNPLLDAEKFIKAVLYKTPNGESLDGMAADIEEITTSFAIEKFTKRIREVLGIDYPLIAIAFSPLSRSIKAIPSNYAWKTIANSFDVIALMTYWHGFPNLRSEKGAYDYTIKTIQKAKEYTQKHDLNIHLIGDGQKTSSQEIVGFLKAANDSKVNAGISLYPWYTPQQHQVEALSTFKF